MELKKFTITKRDGSRDEFSLDKIMNAIMKAFNAVEEPVNVSSISKIISHLNITENVTVEDIQNQVEVALKLLIHPAIDLTPSYTCGYFLKILSKSS